MPPIKILWAGVDRKKPAPVKPISKKPGAK